MMLWRFGSGRRRRICGLTGAEERRAERERSDEDVGMAGDEEPEDGERQGNRESVLHGVSFQGIYIAYRYIYLLQ